MCSKRGGRVMKVTRLIKGKPKYSISESGRILFRIHDTVRRGSTWSCILLFKCPFTSALYSEDNPPHTPPSSARMFLLNSKKLKRRKQSDGSIIVHKNNFIQFPVSDHLAWPSHNYHSKRLLQTAVLYTQATRQMAANPTGIQQRLLR